MKIRKENNKKLSLLLVILIYLYLSTNPLFYTLDLFKLHKNSSNCLDMSFNFSFLYSPTCYDMVKSKVVIFFIYSSGFYIGFYFGFTFFLLYWWWQWRGMWHCGHMTCHIMWCHKSLEWTRVDWSSLNR